MRLSRLNALKNKVLLKNREGMKPLYPRNEKKFNTKIEENESTDSKCDEIEAIPVPLDPSLKESWNKNRRGRRRKAQSHLECPSLKKSTQSQQSKPDKKKRRAEKERVPVCKKQKMQTKQSSINNKSKAPDFHAHDIGMLLQSLFQSQATKIISETWDNASLSIYNQSDNSIHELALQNRLMRDISYYINKVEEDIPFGAYKPRADSPILSLVPELHVSLNACQTLKGDK